MLRNRQLTIPPTVNGNYMKSIKLILIISFINLGSFNTSGQSSLTETIFNADQLEDLQKMTAFFSSQLCGPDFSAQTCLENSSKELAEYGWQPILENINFDEQLELYDSFESNIFNEIWTFCKSANPSEDWERKSICYQPNGKYNAFLFKLGEKNLIIKAYHQDLLESGDFTGITRLENELFNKSGKLELNRSIQIILVIHYLSQNDQQNRIETWTAD